MTIFDVFEILVRDGYTKEEIITLFDYNYHGKNIPQWFEEAEKAEGLDEFGFPNWYEPIANVELGLAMAKTLMAERKKFDTIDPSTGAVYREAGVYTHDENGTRKL